MTIIVVEASTTSSKTVRILMEVILTSIATMGTTRAMHLSTEEWYLTRGWGCIGGKHHGKEVT